MFIRQFFIPVNVVLLAIQVSSAPSRKCTAEKPITANYDNEAYLPGDVLPRLTPVGTYESLKYTNFFGVNTSPLQSISKRAPQVPVVSTAALPTSTVVSAATSVLGATSDLTTAVPTSVLTDVPTSTIDSVVTSVLGATSDLPTSVPTSVLTDVPTSTIDSVVTSVLGATSDLPTSVPTSILTDVPTSTLAIPTSLPTTLSTGILPHSAPNEIVTGGPLAALTSRQLGDDSTGSISATGSTTYFDFKSFYFGCAAYTAEGVIGIPSACTLTVKGFYKGKEQVSQDFDFTPTGTLSSTQDKVATQFAACHTDFMGVDKLTFTVDKDLTVALLDDVSYIPHTCN